MWNDQIAQLTLHVVKGYGPTLFGRDWLGITRSSDWHQIHYSSSSNLQELLDRYGDVFKAGLGTFKGHKARIEVEPNAKPHYRKARIVPFALCKQVCGLVGWLVGCSILVREASVQAMCHNTDIHHQASGPQANLQ